MSERGVLTVEEHVVNLIEFFERNRFVGAGCPNPTREYCQKCQTCLNFVGIYDGYMDTCPCLYWEKEEAVRRSWIAIDEHLNPENKD